MNSVSNNGFNNVFNNVSSKAWNTCRLCIPFQIGTTHRFMYASTYPICSNMSSASRVCLLHRCHHAWLNVYSCIVNHVVLGALQCLAFESAVCCIGPLLYAFAKPWQRLYAHLIGMKSHWVCMHVRELVSEWGLEDVSWIPWVQDLSRLVCNLGRP